MVYDFLRILVILIFTISSKQSNAQAISVAKQILLAERLVDDWERSRHVNLDPRATRYIASKTNRFIGIFGIDYRAPRGPEKIDNIFHFTDNSEEKYREILFLYLDDTMKMPKIDSLMERLARNFGHSSKDAGYTPIEVNTYTCLLYTSPSPRDS